MHYLKFKPPCAIIPTLIYLVCLPEADSWAWYFFSYSDHMSTPMIYSMPQSILVIKKNTSLYLFALLLCDTMSDLLFFFDWHWTVLLKISRLPLATIRPNHHLLMFQKRTNMYFSWVSTDTNDTCPAPNLNSRSLNLLNLYLPWSLVWNEVPLCSYWPLQVNLG